MTEAEFIREIEDLIDDIIENNGPVTKAWITHEIVKRHSDFDGPDADHARLSQFKAVGNATRHIIQRRYRIDSDEPDAQQVLPGCKHMRRAYSIQRDKEQTIERVERLSLAELDAKIIELRTMGMACQEHADELQRYRDMRAEQLERESA